MRKRTAAALLAAVAAALAYRPSRETIGDVLITLGGHLAYGPPPPMSDAGARRMTERVMAEIRATEAARNGQRRPPVV